MLQMCVYMPQHMKNQSKDGWKRRVIFSLQKITQYMKIISVHPGGRLKIQWSYKLSAYGVPPLYARKKIDVVEKIVSGVNKLYFYFKGKKIMEHNLAKKRGEWILPETLPSKQTNQKKVAEGRLVEVQERDLEYYNQFFNQ